MKTCPACNSSKIEKFRRGDVIVIACRNCGYRNERKINDEIQMFKLGLFLGYVLTGIILEIIRTTIIIK